jgi:hypothetical protein
MEGNTCGAQVYSSDCTRAVPEWPERVTAAFATEDTAPPNGQFGPHSRGFLRGIRLAVAQNARSRRATAPRSATQGPALRRSRARDRSIATTVLATVTSAFEADASVVAAFAQPRPWLPLPR